jgi:hypothetical protein
LVNFPIFICPTCIFIFGWNNTQKHGKIGVKLGFVSCIIKKHKIDVLLVFSIFVIWYIARRFSFNQFGGGPTL